MKGVRMEMLIITLVGIGVVAVLLAQLYFFYSRDK